jgi:hypothetical protein
MCLTARIKDLSVIIYKIILWNVIKDILESAACDVAGCEEEIILDHIST